MRLARPQGSPLYEHMGWRGQEQGANLVVKLAAGPQSPDDIGDGDASHACQA